MKGLVVGKFSPMHKGHENLINFAQNHSQQLFIISYTSEHKKYGYSAQLRKQWLQNIAPQALLYVNDENCPNDNASDFEQRNFCAQICQTHNYVPDIVFSSENYGPGFADYLSDYFEKDIKHKMYDKERKNVNISATKIRNNKILFDFFVSSSNIQIYQQYQKNYA